MSTTLRILLSPPDVGSAERAALLSAFDSNWISTAGPAIAKFEEEVGAVLGRPCLALSSGTAGLHLALRLAGVGAGDLVLCQSFTFVASANPILYEKAVPCFLDSEPRTWNLCPNVLEDALRSLARAGRRPKAIVVVHLYGMPAAMEDICHLCERYGVALIEDAAESLGSTCEGQQTGTFGLAGVFSFNGNKIITTAGGGMVALANERDTARLRKWSTQSRDVAQHYEHSEVGFNYRMSNLLAALGSAQFTGLSTKIARRRQIFDDYCVGLKGIPGLSFQPEPPGAISNRWLSTMVLQPEVWGGERDALIAYLAQRGIETRPLWKPMHLQPLFRGATYFGGEVAEGLFRSGLCLPSSSALTRQQQEEVIEHMRQFFQTATERGSIGAAGRPIASPRSGGSKRSPAHSLQPSPKTPDRAEAPNVL